VGPRAGLWTGAENLASTEIRTPDHPARRQSLCPTTLPGPHRHTDDKTSHGLFVLCPYNHVTVGCKYIVLLNETRTGKDVSPKTGS
jgi:hypothetical protein